MFSLKVAHIRQQGVDLIIIPLESSFGFKSRLEQSEIIAGLQSCASSAGLAGTVVPVWNNGGAYQFVAPSNWHGFSRA